MKKINVLLGGLGILGAMFLTLLVLVNKASANPQYFYQAFLNGNIATTSVVYMTPGTATSSLYWDAGLNAASASGSESAALAIFFNASSSVSTLLINQEFAQGTSGVNCATTPTQCDWYEGNQTSINSFGTTTLPIAGINTIGVVPQFSWTFASSTIGGQILSVTNNTASRLITVQTPTRYSRFVFSLKPIANGNGSVWAGVVAKKQNP